MALFSGTEDKRPNIINDAPLLLLLKKMSEVLGAVSQELWMKTKYDYIYPVNHNIIFLKYVLSIYELL